MIRKNGDRAPWGVLCGLALAFCLLVGCRAVQFRNGDFNDMPRLPIEPSTNLVEFPRRCGYLVYPVDPK
jgi:hypothetical protein